MAPTAVSSRTTSLAWQVVQVTANKLCSMLQNETAPASRAASGHEGLGKTCQLSIVERRRGYSLETDTPI